MNIADAAVWRVLVTVLLGTLTVSVSNSALNLAIPTLVSDFDASVVHVSWVMTLFLLCMAMTMPATGFLAARFGSRRIYLAGTWLFLGASLAGAAANGLNGIIAARGVQGVAAGLMIPLALPLIFAVADRGRRGRITGIWGFSVMLGPAIGPSVGGLLLDAAHWQALFLMNLPIAALALVGGYRHLPTGVADTLRRFDAIGFVLAPVGVGCLLFALGSIDSPQDLSSASRLTPLCLGLFLLALFVYTERRVTQPLLDLQIFANRNYSLSLVVVCIQAVGTFGCLLLIPLWMQRVQGHDALTVGLVFLPAALAAAVVVVWAGRQLDRGAPQWMIFAGLLLTAVSMLGFATLDEYGSAWLIVALMLLRGIGLGMSYMPITTVGLNAVPDDRMTEASATNNLARRLSASLGVVALSIFYETRLAQQTGAGLSPMQAEMSALRESFIALGILMLAVMPLALLLNNTAVADRTGSRAGP